MPPKTTTTPAAVTNDFKCEACGKPATMQCPKCREIGLTPSHFCSQTCFKENWKTHKDKHVNEKPACTIPTMTEIEKASFNFPGTLRPGLMTPKRFVPLNIARPEYADHPDGRSLQEENDKNANKCKKVTAQELAKIRRVCALSREILDIACLAVKPGITTDEIDRIVHEATVARGLYPSPLNYYNFPKSCCTSINEIICHGIPDSTVLKEGDIVNLDISSFGDGVHADLNETVFVGKPDADSVRLVHCAYECMKAGINMVKPDNLYRHCGDAIEERATKDSCSVVRTYSGHGVGLFFHHAPSIPHYANNKGAGTMQPGHVFTIEPMINLGVWQDDTWPDRWTSTTKDGKRSSQFEHTMVVTDKGVELLTDFKDGIPFYQKQLKEFGITVEEKTPYADHVLHYFNRPDKKLSDDAAAAK
jgi:methionyl aminopeptidase